MPGGGTRRRASRATLATAEKSVYVVGASSAAGMEASRCRLGPSGDRSDRAVAGLLLSEAEGRSEKAEILSGSPAGRGRDTGLGDPGRDWVRRREANPSPCSRVGTPVSSGAAALQPAPWAETFGSGPCSGTFGVFVSGSVGPSGPWVSLGGDGVAPLCSHCPAVSPPRRDPAPPGRRCG